MTTRTDFKRDLDAYRAERGRFRTVEVPDLRYLMVDGHGDPNTSPTFVDAVGSLYPVAYKLKFASKRDLGRDYVVPPLEGLWWADDMDAFTVARDRSRWDWTLMIMVPDWIDEDAFVTAVEVVGAKGRPARLDDVRLGTLSEGRCVQTLHVGPFDDEADVLAQMHHEFIPGNSLRMHGEHHEIYLSDFRTVAPEEQRTILRQPVTTDAAPASAARAALTANGRRGARSARGDVGPMGSARPTRRRRDGAPRSEGRDMRGITPHLWFDTEAVEAARFYCETFPDSRVTDVSTLQGTPSGAVDVVTFELFGQPFMAISAGPQFRFDPSVSFAVACASSDEVDRYWARLSDGGSAVMELGSYPFSERYGWTTDRYGLSWQVSLAADAEVGQRITPTLTFSGAVRGRAEEAIGAYTSVFPDAGVDLVVPYGPDTPPNPEGDVAYASFRLAGQQFAAMDSALDHGSGFNEAISFLVTCDDQAELDRYTDALSAVPEAEQCGWIADRFGLSWQISPAELDRMLSEGSDEQVARVTEAFLAMKRLDLVALRRAYAGDAAVGQASRS